MTRDSDCNFCISVDLYVEKMRYKAVSCISRSYRPTVPVSYIAQVVGFSSTSEGSDQDPVGVEECVEWLKAHGACLTADSNGEMQLDTKVSSASTFFLKCKLFERAKIILVLYKNHVSEVCYCQV